MRRKTQNPLISSQILCPFAEQSSLVGSVLKWRATKTRSRQAVFLNRWTTHIRQNNNSTERALGRSEHWWKQAMLSIKQTVLYQLCPQQPDFRFEIEKKIGLCGILRPASSCSVTFWIGIQKNRRRSPSLICWSFGKELPIFVTIATTMLLKKNVLKRPTCENLPENRRSEQAFQHIFYKRSPIAKLNVDESAISFLGVKICTDITFSSNESEYGPCHLQICRCGRKIDKCRLKDVFCRQTLLF
jgi:hypothetical protein